MYGSTRNNIVFILVVNLLSCASSKSHLRVINGELDNANEFPFAVALETKDFIQPGSKSRRLCSGSLITETWVITAAHCVIPFIQEPYAIHYGNVTVPREESGDFKKIRKWIQHPFYQHTEMFGREQNEARSLTRNDIGLLQVEKVPVKVFVKISALDHMSLIGHSAKYAGFGMTDLKMSEKAISQPLKIGDTLIVKCTAENDPQGFPNICLSPKCGKSQMAFRGDSGGPLVAGGKLVGVCSRIALQVIYTPVSPYLTWIHDTVAKTAPN